MSDKYLVIIEVKGNKKNIKYFLINKANRKLLDIIDNYTKSHKPHKTITGGMTGGTKGQTNKSLFNPSVPPFNPFGTPATAPSPAATNKPKSPKSKSPKSKSPKSKSPKSKSPKSKSPKSKSPKSPEVPKEIKDIIGQEHSGKKEYMTYNSYVYHDEYIEFKKYNEINIEIPALTNLTKERRGKIIQNVELESNRNGMTNKGAILYKGSNPPKIGTIIAGNSGRPGGACGNFDGTLVNINPNHRTQEEDIISNWFMTYMYNKNITEEEAKIYYGNKLFEYTIFNRWGLLFPYAKRTDIKNYYKTIQGINYRYAKPNDYATAWTIDNVYLSDKFYKYKASRYIHENQYKTTLVFVAGPNNNNPGTNGKINSVFRTYNKETDKNFDLFMNGVEAALFAGLIAMVYSKCNVALLVNVSGGLYRGNHDKEDYKNAYLNSLDNLLMNVQINGVELGSYFDAVYLL
jgi:hypothetical protein